MYPRLVQKVYFSRWAIRPDALSTILGVLHSRLAGEAAPLAIAKAAASAAPVLSPDSGTVVLFGSGILGKHLSQMDMDCGGLSVDALQSALSAAAADPAVRNIVLHLDTPGGVVTGIPETADLIASIAKRKCIVAFCDSLCASAGYWLASACSAIYCTKSAELGSIGVYSAFMDLTAAYAQKGVKVELFKDGTHKAAGYPGTPLTDEQRADILAGVMATSAAFKGDVTARRPHVTADTMQGQCFTGLDAVRVGLADLVVDSMADVLADLSRL